MITPEYCQLMARYNRWMNERLYATCSAMQDVERKRDRGAFFGSIHGTLNHLLWGDRMGSVVSPARHAPIRNSAPTCMPASTSSPANAKEPIGTCRNLPAT
jgi:hypothetical protein